MARKLRQKMDSSGCNGIHFPKTPEVAINNRERLRLIYAEEGGVFKI